ncbi:hypothetical protein Salat_1104200 [Sesamum alatum]|uniref:DUF4283 domain-containing protein n=1 Tax=Sesamum alatum TaxID=300844 RepID=A0AAE1YNT3_9LAMI|nr:hypothetical protein Salat_1104200 [Sesamum alatum]
MDLGLNLSLTEEEDEGLVVSVQNLQDHNADYSNALMLVGRVLSHRTSNFDLLKSTIQSLLQPVKGLQIRRVSEDGFCLYFNHKLDLQRALDGRPWVFDRSLLIMERVEDGNNPLDISLDWSPFTVLVHDIPLSLQTSIIAEHIGNKNIQNTIKMGQIGL